MAIVVSDTSPVRALAHLGLLHVLRDVFGEVLIARAVADELERPARRRFVPVLLSSHPFLLVRTATDASRVAELAGLVDAGGS